MKATTTSLAKMQFTECCQATQAFHFLINSRLIDTRLGRHPYILKTQLIQLQEYVKLLHLAPLLIIFTCVSAVAQQSCLTISGIEELDARWEQANLHPDPAFFESLLSDNFVWVHNHASLIDSKDDVVKRAKTQAAKGSSDTRSRVTRDVKVSITGSTAVVTGFTLVDRGPVPTDYHFMRTYVEINGSCLLVSNHTMAVPAEENK